MGKEEILLSVSISFSWFSDFPRYKQIPVTIATFHTLLGSTTPSHHYGMYRQIMNQNKPFIF